MTLVGASVSCGSGDRVAPRGSRWTFRSAPSFRPENGGVDGRNEKKKRYALASLHRHRLRQVARLVDIGALEDGGVVGEQLDRDGVE